ncbi:MAG TPA: ATP-grasp domain-containing protein [Patescibacteria group bacterium]|nr:ATP-grasp domain-containing protein [Patescibacteria group bacterium]
MKIAILGAGGAPESTRLKEEAEKRGHSADLVGYKQFSIKYEPKLVINIDGEDLAQKYDLLLPRGVTKHPEEAQILAKYMLENGRLVIDQRLAKQPFFLGKHFTSFQFAKNHLPQPETWYFMAKKISPEKFNNLPYPIIIKHNLGKQSKDIYLINNFGEAEKFFQNHLVDNYLIQEFIPTNSYIRILVVGNKVLGAMVRTKAHGIPLAGQNASSGVHSKSYPMNPKLAKLAIAANQAEKNDISGVDVLEHKGKYYLLEANRGPMFKSFEKITGINVAKKIIEYFEEL